jgi:glycerol-3-phosphate dehydrogenase
MKRDLAKLRNTSYDLVIIGGGIHGACAAREATLRGLSVALIEQGDFGHATSASSQRIIHGGLRYLQSLDLRRMRESVRERRTLLRIAPHLVHPLPCLMPTYARRGKGRLAMAAAFLVNDLESFDRNRGIPDPAHRIPPARIISRAECLGLAPGLDAGGLTGGALWFDGQICNSERLTLSFVLSAAESGADVANHVQATGFLREGSRITGVTVEDRLTGRPFAIRARLALNAGGPWVNRVLASLNGRRTALPAHVLKGICLVTRPLPNSVALAVESRGERSQAEGLLFLTPWRDRSLVGCAYPVHTGDPEDCRATEDEIQCLLDDVNLSYPPARLTRDDVFVIYAGLLPAARPGSARARPAFERRHRIVDHARTDGTEGLISLVGVKYTTARGVAEKAVDLALAKLGRARRRSSGSETPVHGGTMESFGDLVARLVGERPCGLPEASLRRLAHNHGAACRDVLAWLRADPTAAGLVPGSPDVIKAEVINAVRREMAMTLGDVVFRRTDLGSAGHPGEPCLSATAAIVARELGWSGERTASELADVQARFDTRPSGQLVTA